MRSKKLDIQTDSKAYRADDIQYGRLIKRFASSVSREAFNQSFQHWNTHLDLTGTGDLPLLYPERRLYSKFASAINKVTPVHLSEWPFNPSEEDTENSRRVDYWCLAKGGENGKAINYFIELKKASYCLSEGTDEDFTEHVKDKINDLLAQVSEIKKIRPKWGGDGSAFLGMLVIHGYHAISRQPVYGPSTIRENLVAEIDGRMGAQVLLTTWKLPQQFDIQQVGGLRDRIVKFISIASIAITKKIT